MISHHDPRAVYGTIDLSEAPPPSWWCRVRWTLGDVWHGVLVPAFWLAISFTCFMVAIRMMFR